MKRIYSLLAAAAVLILGAASCQVISEDAFSTEPVAPELYDHSDILITANTMDEDVNFSWKPYRNLPEGLTYTLYMASEGQEVPLHSSTDLFFKTSKESFEWALYDAFPGLPLNDTFTITFRVAVEAEGKTYSSQEQTLKIYAYGDAIASEVTSLVSEVVLDPAAPDGMIDILTWTPARLVYGETVLYDVYVTVGDKEVKIAEGLADTFFSVKTDDLNEAIIAAGGTEAESNLVNFIVVAHCESLPDGVPGLSDLIDITTYLSTFPDQLYLPGSYQGWDPASAPTILHSSVQKGFFQGIVDMRTADGSDVEFKFCPVPSWTDDFGGTVEVNPNGSGEYPTASGTVGVSDNIKVPSGVYYIEVDKKLNIIRMVQFGSLSLIGSAVGDYGWGQDVDLEFDPQTKTFVAVTEFKAGEFKMRFNHNWDQSLGGSAEAGYTLIGGNITTDKEGEYRIVVDASAAPIVIKYINTSFPERLYVPGSHNEWNHAATVLEGNGEGQFEGFANIGGEWGFKFTPAPDWSHGEWGFLKGSAPVEEVGEDGNPTGWTIYQLTDTDAGNIREGSDVTYCKVIVDLTDLTVRVAPVTSVGIIGGFDGNVWSSDQYQLEYNAGTDSWKVTGVELSKATEWKFRMNEDWKINLGGAFDNLTQDGANLKVAESGVYDVELFIGTTPYKAVLTKTGGSSEPEYPENMYMIGLAFGNWTWDSDDVVELTPVNGKAGQFWTIRYIEAGSPFKFCGKRDWVGDFNSLGENTGFTTEGGNCFVPESAVYMIYVDVANDKLCIERAQVYGMGNCFGGWTEGMAEALFSESDGKLVGTTLAEGEIRLYAASSIATSDWWTREFVFFDGKIAYRGNGGDQDRVFVEAGKTVTLDFNAGTATVE